MPKAILEFSLPEDEDALKLARRGSGYYSFLTDLDQELRGWIKYGGCPYKTVNELMEYIREKINEEVEIYDIE